MTTRLYAIAIGLLLGAAACSVPNQSPMTTIENGAAKAATLPTFTVFTAGTTPGLPVTAVPRDIAAGPNGTVWFTDLTTPAIGSISPKLAITEYAAGLPNGAQPYAIIAGPDGNMWFSDSAAIGRITPAGKIVEFGSGIPAGVSPGGLAVGGGDKAIWSVGVGTPSVLLRITLDGAISTFKIPPSITPDGSIAADAAGNVWFFASRPNHNVVLAQRTKGGGIVLNRIGLVTKGEPCCPNIATNHITIGSDGNPWFTTPYSGVASSFYHMVGTFANGKATLYREVTGKLTYQVYPSGITSPGKSMWFSGSNPLGFDGALWRLTTNGKQVSYPIPYDPAGLTATSESVLWFTSQAAGRAPQIVRAVF